MSNDFFDGYVQGKQLQAARDIARIRDDLQTANSRLQRQFDTAIAQRDEALEYNKSINEKYKNLLHEFDILEADRDAAYERIGELRKVIGMSQDEAYDPVDERREALVAERMAAKENE